MRYVRIVIAFVVSVVVGTTCALIILAVESGVSFRSLKAYVILSGSMEPEVPLGSLVLVRPFPQYSIGDIISFALDPTDKIPTTHRITKINGTSAQNNLLYETKGDTNNAVDIASVKQNQVIGRVFLTVPYIGYAAQAAKTKKGFIFLIVVPSTIIIYEELKTLKKELTNLLKKLKGKKANNRALIFVPMIASIFVFTSYSRSFFSDKETSSGNSFQAGTWATSASPIAGNVVINEVMWMGSHESTFDEWIELKNTTTSDIDLTSWTITNAGSGSNSIVLSGSIPASGFFLISHYPSSTSSINNSITVDQVVAGIELGNDGEQLVLKNSGEVIIDQTLSGSWPAGINGTSSNPDQSMERNNDPSTGWHTCTDSACHSTTYWDIDGLNWGTPKTQNI